MEEKEIWKNIEGFPLYQVSNYGRFKSLNYNHTKKEKVLQPQDDNCGYKHLTLCVDGKGVTKSCHRIVAKTFIPNPNNYQQVNHKNEDKSDNRVSNLRMVHR